MVASQGRSVSASSASIRQGERPPLTASEKAPRSLPASAPAAAISSAARGRRGLGVGEDIDLHP